MLEHLPESVSRQQVGDCVLNQNGFYGQPLGQPYRINFAYQVLLVEGTTQAQVSSQVTDSLDRAVPEALLPYYFACGDVRRNLQSGGTINGVSRLLTDTPIFSGESRSKTPCVAKRLSSFAHTFNRFGSRSKLCGSIT